MADVDLDCGGLAARLANLVGYSADGGILRLGVRDAGDGLGRVAD